MNFFDKPDPQTFLAHHGIKGQKWGIRRFQNKDGSLTEAGRKRVSKQYAKEAVRVMEAVNKNYSSMYVKSYNKVVDYMNNGGLDKFNKQQQEKYGKDYEKRDGYDEELTKTLDKMLDQNLNESLLEFYENNDSFKKANALIEQYGMTEWDDLAKSNTEAIEDIRIFLFGNKK